MRTQVLPKRSCTLWKLVNTQTKEITLLCIEKNICISCVLVALSVYIHIALGSNSKCENYFSHLVSEHAAN